VLILGRMIIESAFGGHPAPEPPATGDDAGPLTDPEEIRVAVPA
jgi:hypothetical protein